MAKEVKVLKLLSGEEIITRIKSLDDDSDKYVCEKPMITQPVPIQGGQMAMGMSAWMFAGNIDEVENARSSVIAITSATCPPGIGDPNGKRLIIPLKYGSTLMKRALVIISPFLG